MKTIFLDGKDDTSKLQGKIVKEVSFLSRECPHLIITFTESSEDLYLKRQVELLLTSKINKILERCRISAVS